MLHWHKSDHPTHYEEMLSFMESLVAEVIDQKAQNTIILTEHEDIITGGTSAAESELLYETDIPILRTGRGGKYTFHGKGQRIIYPIIDLTQKPWNRDLRKYIRFLHKWIIATLEEFGLVCHMRDDHIGIWARKNNNDAKIAAIGIRVRKWVTFHGIAVNLSTDLGKFRSIVPCGISDLHVTSAQDLGYNITSAEFDEALKKTYITLYEGESLV